MTLRPGRTLASSLMLASMLIVPSLPSGAQDSDEDDNSRYDWLAWDSVDRFTGQATVRYHSWTNRDDGFSKEKNQGDDAATLQFELRREADPYSTGGTRWVAAWVQITGQNLLSMLSESGTHRITFSSKAEFTQELVGPSSLSLSLNHETGEFELLLPARLDTPVPESTERSEWRYMGGTETESRTGSTTNMASINFNGTATKTIGSLSASANIEFEEEDGGAGHYTVGRVLLLPEDNEFEVLVTLEGGGEKGAPIAFENWRPLGSIKAPGTPGNHLLVNAVLQPTGGRNETNLPEVRRFYFELLETSREPGVMMNWPIAARDKEHDLRLAIDPASPGPLGDEAQTLEILSPGKNADGLPAASARIESLDFGGRTELRVFAELQDGRKIFGKLQSGDRKYSRITVPKRILGDWIADAWRADKGVTGLLESDDSENDPVGDGDQGDGLTLYEEYRGFALRRMSGGRVEGDPKRKDFFILNLIGSDAWAGIRLFENETGLRVVHRLEDTEMDPVSRLMNGNHLEAPHLGDQHGVVLRTLTPAQMGHRGAQAFGTDENYEFALKPKTTKHVGMPARNDPGATLNKPWNLPADDLATSYDRTIVHELLHSISVAHHGQGDLADHFRYIPTAYKNKNGNGPQIWQGAANAQFHLVDIREESTGIRLADRIGPAFDMILDNLATQLAADLGMAAGTKFRDLEVDRQWSLIWQLPAFLFQIGVEKGQHSGNEQCPMRYKFAQVYLAKSPVRTPAGREVAAISTYYLVPQGTEDVGTDICGSPSGTGINLVGREPQSRYGDALQDYGACAAQICLNDLLPVHAWGRRR